MKMRTRILLAMMVVLLGMGVMARAQESVIKPAVVAQPVASTQSAGENQPAEETQSEDDQFKKSPSVVAIGKKLGLNPAAASTAFFWINFVIFAGAILYFLVKSLPKTFRGRTETIQKGIVEARSATEEANARLSSVEARLSKLDGEIAAIRTQSEKDSAAEEARIKTQIEEEKQRILQSAEQEIAAAQSHAERSLREYAAQLAIEQAAAQMHISPEQDSALVREFAGRLSKENAN